jgi:hypothetical protein
MAVMLDAHYCEVLKKYGRAGYEWLRRQRSGGSGFKTSPGK